MKYLSKDISRKIIIFWISLVRFLCQIINYYMNNFSSFFLPENLNYTLLNIYNEAILTFRLKFQDHARHFQKAGCKWLHNGEGNRTVKVSRLRQVSSWPFRRRNLSTPKMWLRWRKRWSVWQVRGSYERRRTYRWFLFLFKHYNLEQGFPNNFFKLPL